MSALGVCMGGCMVEGVVYVLTQTAPMDVQLTGECVCVCLI